MSRRIGEIRELEGFGESEYFRESERSEESEHRNVGRAEYQKHRSD